MVKLDRRAILFCKEDRAILCSDCDVPIHTANDLTARHSRFLLTSVRLPSLHSATSYEIMEEKQVKQPTLPESHITVEKGNNNNNNNSSISSTVDQAFCTSSISDYLIKTLPGWHVEDLLVDGVDFSSSSDGFYKNDGLWEFMEGDSDSDIDFVSENQVPHVSFMSGSVCKLGKDVKVHERGGSDHGFTVPQMSPPLKKPRHIWQI